jgi:hypothetical protein
MSDLTADQRERYGRIGFFGWQPIDQDRWDWLDPRIQEVWIDVAAAVIAAYRADTADERAAIDQAIAAVRLMAEEMRQTEKELAGATFAFSPGVHAIFAADAALDAARQEKTT